MYVEPEIASLRRLIRCLDNNLILVLIKIYLSLSKNTTKNRMEGLVEQPAVSLEQVVRIAAEQLDHESHEGNGEPERGGEGQERQHARGEIQQRGTQRQVTRYGVAVEIFGELEEDLDREVVKAHHAYEHEPDALVGLRRYGLGLLAAAAVVVRIIIIQLYEVRHGSSSPDTIAAAFHVCIRIVAIALEMSIASCVGRVDG